MSPVSLNGSAGTNTLGGVSSQLVLATEAPSLGVQLWEWKYASPLKEAEGRLRQRTQAGLVLKTKSQAAWPFNRSRRHASQ